MQDKKSLVVGDVQAMKKSNSTENNTEKVNEFMNKLIIRSRQTYKLFERLLKG